jgi:hypothetical protein
MRLHFSGNAKGKVTAQVDSLKVEGVTAQVDSLKVEGF